MQQSPPPNSTRSLVTGESRFHSTKMIHTNQNRGPVVTNTIFYDNLNDVDPQSTVLSSYSQTSFPPQHMQHQSNQLYHQQNSQPHQQTHLGNNMNVTTMAVPQQTYMTGPHVHYNSQNGGPRMQPTTQQRQIQNPGQRQMQPKVAVPVITRPTSSVLKLSCMYTKQINKKRKVWSDGLLKVVIDGDIYQCTLIDAEDVREIGLDSRQLEPAEVNRFKTRKPHQLDMENYIVDISFDDLEAPDVALPKTATGGPSLKLPKFVPPSRYVPQPHQLQYQQQPINRYGQPPQQRLHQQPTSNSTSFGGRSYQMTDAELDDIWGGSNGTEQPQRKEFIHPSDHRSSKAAAVTVASSSHGIHNSSRPSNIETIPGWDDFAASQERHNKNTNNSAHRTHSQQIPQHRSNHSRTNSINTSSGSDGEPLDFYEASKSCSATRGFKLVASSFAGPTISDNPTRNATTMNLQPTDKQSSASRLVESIYDKEDAISVITDGSIPMKGKPMVDEDGWGLDVWGTESNPSISLGAAYSTSGVIPSGNKSSNNYNVNYAEFDGSIWD